MEILYFHTKINEQKAQIRRPIMKNKGYCLGMLVIVLVFGMTVVGCSDDSDNNNGNGNDGGSGETDSALNGTWIRDLNGYTFTFNNGKFEDDPPRLKGNYTTNENRLIAKVTHIYGGWGALKEDRWYTKFETKTLLGVTDDEIDYQFIPPCTYSINGNKLILTYDYNGSINEFTKQE
jgi:hypothetical protein